jgi:hypothetical protein
MMKRLFERQKLLIVAGAVSFALFLALAVVSLFDATEVAGVNRWIKPMKFTISPAIYLWTLAVYLYFIEGRERAKKTIASGAIATMAGEIALIVMQAARGTTSHFNTATVFDFAVFQAMGFLIVVNTALVVYLLVLYFRAPAGRLPASIVWGLRFGIILFVVAAFEGGVMSALMRHGVGVADGGEGLRFVNWSTRGGDLRVAHFVGMHALQALPLFAWTLEKYRVRSAVFWTFLAAALYCALFTFVFVQALAGRPLFG